MVTSRTKNGVLAEKYIEYMIVNVPKRHGGVAQLGEHLPCKQGVIGSIPFISTMYTDRGHVLNKLDKVLCHYQKLFIRAHSSDG